MNPLSIFDSTGNSYQQVRIAHWNLVAKKEHWTGAGIWYHQRLAEIFRFLVTPNLKILELGCSEGHLLASLNPARGVGVDFSPEGLPRFYEALVSGKGEFINGVRLVYPMEKDATRTLNLLGNKFFSIAFSWLLGQSIKDTLCGTKVLWKKDYEQIAANRSCFGDFDPFGDFDLIFGAANLNLKILDLPIRYRERIYSSTNISQWKHGLLLLCMVAFAARRIKFI